MNDKAFPFALMVTPWNSSNPEVLLTTSPPERVVLYAPRRTGELGEFQWPQNDAEGDGKPRGSRDPVGDVLNDFRLFQGSPNVPHISTFIHMSHIVHTLPTMFHS